MSKGCISPILVFSDSKYVTEAIITSYKLGSQVDSTKHALQLREGAIQAYKQSDQQAWPPTPEDFECSLNKLFQFR